MMKSYRYEHVVSFEETNALGNVYFSNFLKWQGICRERFLKEHTPELIVRLADGLKIATVACSCSFYWNLYPFDSVFIDMYLDDPGGDKLIREVDVLRISFKYWKSADSQKLLVAEGEQRIAFLYPEPPNGWGRGPLPQALRAALLPFGLAES
jgi:enediyne biosynthesis thioesterase